MSLTSPKEAGGFFLTGPYGGAAHFAKLALATARFGAETVRVTGVCPEYVVKNSVQGSDN